MATIWYVCLCFKDLMIIWKLQVQILISMSFRNTNTFANDKIKIEDSHLSGHLFTSSKLLNNGQEGNDQIIKKISSIIVNLHEGYLAKCRNIQIYRDLSQEEQNLLLTVDKNTAIHTALAGILAIDSCVKCIDKEENFIIANMIRGSNALVAQFKILQKEVNEGNLQSTDYCSKLGDTIKYLLTQMYCLPAARGRQEDQQKQVNLLDKYQIESNEQLHYQQEYQKMIGQLHRQNQILKVSLKEKQGHISLLQNRYERGLPRFQKLQEKKTSHSLAFRMSTEKSSENESNSASVQQFYQQIGNLKEELLEKNNIVMKMNQEFASEMQKYNSVFKRLQDQNRLLKRYSDLDTAYLLEQLQYQIELLRQEKRKDQMVISEIQRKIEGISLTRNSRVNTRHGYEFNRQQYPQHHLQEIPHFQHRPPYQNRYTKFYSPNYATRLSPFSRTNNLKEDIYGQQTYRSNVMHHHPQESHRPNLPHPQETYRSNVIQAQQPYRLNPSHAPQGYRANNSRKMRIGENLIRKSRNRINQSKQSKELIEAKSSPSINLYERVMSKRI